MDLISAYFDIRREASALRKVSGKFEGLKWHKVGKSMTRTSEEGWKLLVYPIEDDIEVCVIDPQGKSQTFC